MRIRLSKGKGKELAEKLGISQVTVSKSLNFKVNSIEAMKVRHFAMNVFGGIIL